MKNSAFSGDTKEKKIRISKARKIKPPANVVGKIPSLGKPIKPMKAPALLGPKRKKGSLGV
jgi:hypothetical protein